MGLNIKNERVHALARRAAEVTGKTQTGAIEEALTLLLDERASATEAKVAAILEAAAEWRSGLTPSLDHLQIEDLYDPVTGQPR